MTKMQLQGLVPRPIHKAQRIKDILEAIMRYHEKMKPIPSEWTDELAELNREQTIQKSKVS